jgi:hypothetical protein
MRLSNQPTSEGTPNGPVEPAGGNLLVLEKLQT